MKKNVNQKKYLIVISYDAFSEDNWEFASKLPHLSSLIGRGVHSTDLCSIYPTLTYAVHTTMVTGEYPDVHGVIHNNPFQPFVEENDQRWYWYRNEVKAPTVYDVCREHGLTTAGLLWPVTGKSSIQYNIPEVKAIGKENQIIKMLRSGSPVFSILMELKHGKTRKGISQPYLDDFTAQCCADTVVKKQPNVMMLHFTDLDTQKHDFGTKSRQVEEAMIRMDARIGLILDAIKRSGNEASTTVMILGDHGQMDVRYQIRLNAAFYREGLIYKEQGTLNWRAYVQGADGCAYLYVRAHDEEAKEKAFAIIHEMMKEKNSGIELLFTGEDIREKHLVPSMEAVLEARNGFYFDDSIEGPVIFDLEKAGLRHATHGYLPQKPGYKCCFLMAGNGIRQGQELKGIHMTDIAPTMAAVMGVEFPYGKGRILKVFTAEDSNTNPEHRKST